MVSRYRRHRFGHSGTANRTATRARLVKFLLDTNVVSDSRLRRSPQVMNWVSDQATGDLALSVVTILELERGIRRKERRDPTGAAPLRMWIDADVRSIVEGRILPVDERIAVIAAGLHIPDPRPEMDALIAATAIAHDLILVTRNTKDFANTGTRLLNPWGL